MSNNNQTAENKAEVKAEQTAEVKKADNKVVEVKAKDVAKDKKKKDKVKKPNKIAKSLKDTGNELKKVSWPGFNQVVKQTGIVLAFVLIFGVVLFGFERLCSWLTGFLF